MSGKIAIALQAYWVMDLSLLARPPREMAHLRNCVEYAGARDFELPLSEYYARSYLEPLYFGITVLHYYYGRDTAFVIKSIQS